MRFCKKMSFENSSKSVIFIKSHFTCHFYSYSRCLLNNRDDIHKNRNSIYSFQLIAVARFLKMSTGNIFSININKCNVHNDLQTRYKAFGMFVTMIHQCATALRLNIILRQRHLSNRYLNLPIAYSCVIGIWMCSN